MTDDPKFSHLDPEGNPNMVDVSAKQVSKRTATALAEIYLPDTVWQEFNRLAWISKKGSIFQTAILAGIMGAKKTAELIPLCHPLGLENCQVQIQLLSDNILQIRCTAEITGKTGVEMEALTGASIAALTVYDMCKAVSHDIEIRKIRLLSKKGGKSDF